MQASMITMNIEISCFQLKKILISVIFALVSLQIITRALGDGGVEILDQNHQTTIPLQEKEVSNIQMLSQDLLKDYDHEMRPVIHHSNTTIVQFNVIPLYILSLEEEFSCFHLDAWLLLEWQDDRLAWDESKYGGISKLHLQAYVIWQPDIIIYNGHSGMIDPTRNALVIVSSTGHVKYVPSAQLGTRCPHEWEGLYPRDKVVCEIEFGSYSYHGWQMDLQVKREKMSTKIFMNTNPRWELLIEEVNMTRDVQHYNCCEEPYVSITASFPMRRRMPPELQVVWTPCVLVMAMTLAMFWIPPKSSKKIYLGMFLFLILCLLIVYVAKVTYSPTSAKRAVMFPQSTMYAVTSAIILEIIVISLCSITGACQPPEFIIQILSSSFGKYVAIRASWETNIPGDKIQLQEDDEQQSTSPTINAKWILLATGLDRLLFIFFLIIFITIHQL